MEFTLTVKDPTPEVMTLLAPLMGGAKVIAAKPGATATASPKPPAKAPDPVETEFEEGPTTLIMLQTLMTEKVQAGKAKAAKALLTKFNVAGVSKLAEDQYGEFYGELKEIK